MSAGRRLARRHSAWIITAGAAALLLAIVSVWMAPTAIEAPWDVFILLDGGCRIWLGQVPNTDFSNPIGPLVYELTAFGMQVGGPAVRSIAHGNVAFVAAISILAWTVVRQRLPYYAILALTIFLTVTLIAVRPLGYAPEITS